MKIERRSFVVGMRAEGDSAKRKLVGHAAVFERWADIGWFREKIERGAFSETIQSDDIRALWNHDPNIVLGRNKAQTLRLVEDDVGLAVEIDLPDTTAAKDLMVSVERGDVSQMSFGFRTVSDQWGTEDGKLSRVLRKAMLFDVSPVTYPAYPETDVSARGLLEARGLDVESIERSILSAIGGQPVSQERLRQAMENAAREAIRSSIEPEDGRSLDLMRKRLELAVRRSA